MSVGTDWTTRVDQMTAATLHEQLRTVVREARELLERFNTASWEQGGLLLDAQRELEATVTNKMSRVSEEVSASLDALRGEMTTLARPGYAAADLDAFRSDVFASLAAFGEELDAETKRLREEITSRMNRMGATLVSMQQSQAQLEGRLAAAAASTDERLGAIGAQIESISRMEERSAARMVDLLASAFVRLRDEQKGPQHQASS